MKTEIFRKYGVTLRPMVEDDLEFVRDQRNRQNMRRWMTTDHEITAEEMRNWFSCLPPESYYWMVEFGGRVVGQANLKGQGAAIAVPGYLFWDEDFQNGGGVPRAVLALFSVAFFEYGFQRLTSLTASDNVRAVRLAKGMGFVLSAVEQVNGQDYWRVVLTPEAFSQTVARYGSLYDD